MKSVPITYSVPEGTKRPGESHIYRHSNYAQHMHKIPEGVSSMGDVWRNTVKQNSKHKCLENFTYEQVDQMTTFVGSWLVDGGFKLIYIHSINRVEWMLIDIACLKFGIVSVTLYDTLGKEGLEHTISLTGGTIMASSKAAVVSFFKANPPSIKNITHLLVFDELDPPLLKEVASRNIKIFSLKEVIDKKVIRPLPFLNLDHHFSYFFTSGTTGLPKGVIITHRNFVSQFYSAKLDLPFNNEDVHLSYLPLQHVFERVFIYVVLFCGGHVRFYSGAITELAKDLAIIKPTVIPIVPRLLNMFYSMLKSFGHVDKELAEKAWKVKVANWEAGIPTSQYDQTVFKRAKDAFGGRLRFMITASAPIAAEVLNFFMVVLGCDIREGYGQTETTAVTFITKYGERSAGHVGGVTRAIEFKLVDLPEMNYNSDGEIPKGEICVRGNPVFKGYFKDKKNTDEAIDHQGWHHTGDVGLIEQNGALKIIDRKKNIYKLSQGEYVAPEKIENIYLRCPLIAEAFVYGESLQSYNVAIVVPNKDALLKLATEKGINKSFEELCQDDTITQIVFDQLTQQGKNDGLFGFQMAKKIILYPISFGSHGIFTNTLKLQRHIAKQVFKNHIGVMYQKPL